MAIFPQTRSTAPPPRPAETAPADRRTAGRPTADRSVDDLSLIHI
ncbi:hypothetical protein [Streptomyces sp. b94]|nr:hypothetical protein [Streptomyces sp. b94]